MAAPVFNFSFNFSDGDNSQNTSTHLPPRNETNSLVPFSDELKITCIVLLFSLMFLGVFLNSATIVVLARSKKLKNIYNDFILSMSVSNLLAALVSWINLYRLTWGYNHFKLSPVFCKMYWGIEIWTSYATAWHIMFFALLRFMSIKYSATVKRITRKQVKIFHLMIWTITFAFGFTPMLFFIDLEFKDRSKKYGIDAIWPHCSQAKQWMSTYGEYSNVAYPVFIIAPIAVVVAVSALTACVIRGERRRVGGTVAGSSLSEAAARRRRAREKQALTQLVLIVSSFLAGYIPFIAFEYYTQHTMKRKDHYGQSIWLVATFAYYPLRISECLDPIFYCLGSRKIRFEMMRLVSDLFRCDRIVWEEKQQQQQNGRRNTTTSG